jgi:hypothetical protein
MDNKTAYFRDTLENANAKSMYNVLNSLLNSSVQKLPACVSNLDLSNRFACYFTEKVTNIRSELDQMCNTQSVNSVSNDILLYKSTDNNVCINVNDMSSIEKTSSCNISCDVTDNGVQLLEHFSYVSEEEVRKIIAKLPNKTSSIDPMPTWLLKRSIDILLPVITSIINNSFRLGSFPRVLRQAVITPLIKKPTLDPNVFKNYRPVSNLPTLGKIIEYPAVSSFKQHLQDNNLSEIYQSAYKSSHSTETALLKVKNDMLHELDKGKAILLVLLDLSSAFDTIDHVVLVDRMQKEFGIAGSAISWFASYLENRTTRVCVLGEYSENHILKYGVPQGSVAGPPIFTAYAQPVANIIKRFEVGYHIYADDTQLYVSFDPKSEEDKVSAKLRLSECISEIRSWMLGNKLKLNDSKTELFLISSPRIANAVSNLDLKIGGSVITPSNSIKNLGIIFDKNLTMKDHVSSLCRSVNFHLRNLNRIRRFIDKSTCAHAVRSLILSRLDYGNSLLGGVSVSDVQRM